MLDGRGELCQKAGEKGVVGQENMSPIGDLQNLSALTTHTVVTIGFEQVTTTVDVYEFEFYF